MLFSAPILPTRVVEKFSSWKIYLPTVITIIIFALVATLMSWKMLRDGVIFASHDLHYHLIWLQHFSKQLTEGIPYPRWLAGTNYGYGSPTFVFYPPLIYYFGSVLKLLGLSADQAVIALFWLALFGAGCGFYLYGRSRWSRTSALVGAILYMTSPYFAVNLYVRGALPETCALIWIPIGLWLTDRALEVLDPLLAESQGQATQGKVTVIQWDSYDRKLLVDVQQASALLLRTYAYPAWQLWVNGQLYQATGNQLAMAEDGRIKLQLNPGTHNITMHYGWTTAFLVGVIISVGAAIALNIWMLQACQRFRPVGDDQAS